MGVWTRANGRLEVIPPPDDQLLVDFWEFSEGTWSEDYEKIDERFSNTWFFDENNKLACIAGKFGEPWVWLDWMREHFFTPRGYKLEGDEEIIGEGDLGVNVFGQSIVEEYRVWQCRVSELRKDADNFIFEENVDVDIPKVFWKYYDLYRRKIITLEEYSEKTHISREMLIYYLSIIRDLPGKSITVGDRKLPE